MPMFRHLLLTAAIALPMAAPATAETLKWATARDIYGLDPHAVTDSFTNIFTHHIYEPLVRYDADAEDRTRAGDQVGSDRAEPHPLYPARRASSSTAAKALMPMTWSYR
jgi:ABC-type transport system substrate-binding protein